MTSAGITDVVYPDRAISFTGYNSIVVSDIVTGGPS
jgi:hypothetical protein